jgi:hypothetical protein
MVYRTNCIILYSNIITQMSQMSGLRNLKTSGQDRSKIFGEEPNQIWRTPISTCAAADHTFQVIFKNQKCKKKNLIRAIFFLSSA